MNASGQPQNKLLHFLSRKSLDRIKPSLELVPIKPKRILQHARLPIEEVYFIETGLVSVDVITDPESRHAAEGWLTGPEGFTGVPVALGFCSRLTIRWCGWQAVLGRCSHPIWS